MDDEPVWQWPAWKFGMKRDDLFTKLHDKYNTLSTPIQDREAFHHDVYEISSLASSKDEFHRLLADRKQQRLDELNRGLESASVEIIANPTLIGTEQWQYALQLFRARSLDSLVRYFSSYLPESHPWHSDVETDTETNSVRSDISNSRASSISSTDTDVNVNAGCGDATTIYLTDKVTLEPFPISTNVSSNTPLSPPSSTADDDSTVVSPTDLESHHDYLISHPTPSSRSMSFSGSESGRFCPHDLPRFEDCDDDEASEASEDPASPSTDMTDLDFVPIAHDDKDISTEHSDSQDTQSDAAAIAHSPSQCQPYDTCGGNVANGMDEDPDTPTPRPFLSSHDTSYITAKLSQQNRRSPSPSPKNRDQRRCPRTKRREATPPQVARSPCELLSRIQKPLTDTMRTRLTARKRIPTEL